MNIEHRGTGWLTDEFHLRFREILLHACARYRIASCIHVLMPDHVHLLWLGLHESSDQRLAVAFLRRNLEPALHPHHWQTHPYDHVLREQERQQGAMESTAEYILENPERAELCANWREYPYLGTGFCGYPELDPRLPDFWMRFWRCYNFIVERTKP